MALVNPNIALGVKSVEVQDPMAQYAKIAAIQGAQNQNALNQYQLSAARRADETQNALAQAYAQSVDPTSGKIDYNKLTSLVAGAGGGAQLPAIQKSRMEQETAQTAQQKAQSDLLDAKLKQSRGFLDTIDPADPTAPARYLAWHEANHKDPIIGAALTARGVSAEQARQSIEAAIAKGPQAFAQMLNQSKLGTEKFMEMNKPQLSTKDTGGTIIDRTFEPLTGKITNVGAPTAKTMTPGEVESNKIAQTNANLAREKFNLEQANAGQAVTYQQDANGNIVALPTKVKPGDIPRGRTVAAPGEGMSPMAGKPSEAAAKETASLNQQKAIVQGALDAIEKNPNAFGTTRGLAGGVLGETFGARAVGETPEETQARSFLFNVVSGVIKERAGTAQSAGEQATLDRFLPTTKDNADELTAKLKGFQTYLKARESAGKKPGGGNPPPSAPTVVVTPDGQSHTFPTAAAAAQFKKAAGL